MKKWSAVFSKKINWFCVKRKKNHSLSKNSESTTEKFYINERKTDNLHIDFSTFIKCSTSKSFFCVVNSSCSVCKCQYLHWTQSFFACFFHAPILQWHHRTFWYLCWLLLSSLHRRFLFLFLCFERQIKGFCSIQYHYNITFVIKSQFQFVSVSVSFSFSVCVCMLCKTNQIFFMPQAKQNPRGRLFRKNRKQNKTRKRDRNKAHGVWTDLANLADFMV